MSVQDRSSPAAQWTPVPARQRATAPQTARPHGRWTQEGRGVSSPRSQPEVGLLGRTGPLPSRVTLAHHMAQCFLSSLPKPTWAASAATCRPGTAAVVRGSRGWSPCTTCPPRHLSALSSFSRETRRPERPVTSPQLSVTPPRRRGPLLEVMAGNLRQTGPLSLSLSEMTLALQDCRSAHSTQEWAQARRPQDGSRSGGQASSSSALLAGAQDNWAPCVAGAGLPT